MCAPDKRLSQEADVRCLHTIEALQPDSFAGVLDKGTMDALL
jgi:hypothetical protein